VTYARKCHDSIDCFNDFRNKAVCGGGTVRRNELPNLIEIKTGLPDGNHK
jgi:hypothetical protein